MGFLTGLAQGLEPLGPNIANTIERRKLEAQRDCPSFGDRERRLRDISVASCP